MPTEDPRAVLPQPNWLNGQVAPQELGDSRQQLRAEIAQLTLQLEQVTKSKETVMQALCDANEEYQEAVDQGCGGGADPRVVAGHPGIILLKAGWTYHPGEVQEGSDESRGEWGSHQACLYCWQPPREYEEPGKTSTHTFAGALHIEYQRLETKFRENYPTAWDRLTAEKTT